MPAAVSEQEIDNTHAPLAAAVEVAQEAALSDAERRKATEASSSEERGESEGEAEQTTPKEKRDEVSEVEELDENR